MFSNDDMYQVFSALAHTTRREILHHLRNKPGMTVGELAQSFDVTRDRSYEPPSAADRRWTCYRRKGWWHRVFTYHHRRRREQQTAQEMPRSQGFISLNIEALAETGQPAFTGRMVGIPAPVFAMFAKSEQRIAHWPP